MKLILYSFEKKSQGQKTTCRVSAHLKRVMPFFVIKIQLRILSIFSKSFVFNLCVSVRHCKCELKRYSALKNFLKRTR